MGNRLYMIRLGTEKGDSLHSERPQSSSIRDSQLPSMASANPPHPRRSAQFTLSLPSSPASSRNSSPAPQKHASRDSKLDNGADEPGRLPVDVYDVMLPRWRAAIRKRLVRTVERESQVIARMQVRRWFKNRPEP